MMMDLEASLICGPGSMAPSAPAVCCAGVSAPTASQQGVAGGGGDDQQGGFASAGAAVNASTPRALGSPFSARRYAPPIVASFDGPGSSGATTRGGQLVTISGAEFGSDESKIKVWYEDGYGEDGSGGIAGGGTTGKGGDVLLSLQQEPHSHPYSGSRYLQG